MWPSPPTPITTAVVPGTSSASERLIAWYGVSPASVSGAAATGIEVTERDEVARVGHDHQRRHAAVEPEPTAGRADLALAHAVVLEALHAAVAATAAPRPVDRHRCADLEAGDAGPERLDPARVLVTQRERRAPRQHPAVEVVHEMEVGVTRAGAADPHQHRPRPGLGLGHFRELRFVVPAGESQCAHARLSRRARDQH